MDCYNIFVDIVIPLVSAFIGGFVTLAGVWLTIRRDKKREKENYKKSVKPWIYSIDNAKNSDLQNEIIMATSASSESKHGLFLTIKNTDNGIAIVDKFVTKNKIYIPIFGKIIDKSQTIGLHIHFEPGETIEDMYLYVRDILGNVYKYEVFQHNLQRRSNYIEEVIEN